ncbi:MAG: hypothetical protein VKP72_11410 [bacterium]|nr:hypothetical protein [bacterium]
MTMNISGTGPLRQPAAGEPAAASPANTNPFPGLAATVLDEIERKRGNKSQMDLGPGSTFVPQTGGQQELDAMNAVTQLLELSSKRSAEQIEGNTDVNIDGGTTAKAKQKKVEVPKPSGGGFFGSIMNAIKSILPVLSMVAMFIPGLNVLAMAVKVAQVALAAADTMQALMKGDLKGALGGLTSLAGSIGGPLGEFAKMGQAGMNVVDGFQKGGLAGGLGAMGDFFGGDFGKFLGTAGQTIGALEKGDVAGALGALGAPGGVADLLGPDAGRIFQGAVNAANGAVQGDLAAALGGVAQATGSRELAGLGSALDAVRTGDVGGIARAANTLGILPDDLNRQIGAIEQQAQPVLRALSNQDVEGLGRALGGAVEGGLLRRATREAETARQEVLISDRRTELPSTLA